MTIATVRADCQNRERIPKHASLKPPLVDSMFMDFKTLEREALELQPADRAKLAHELLESLESLSTAELDALWLDEAERRARQLDSGGERLVPGEEVARKARALPGG